MLCAGVLVVGLILGALIFAAPALIPGSGLSATDGPRVDRVLVQLAAGVIGELWHWRRTRLTPGLRLWGALAVIVVVLFALWFAWW